MVDVVVVAAGSGRRLGASVPKAFVSLGGKPLFYYSVNFFQKHPDIDNIIITVPKGFVEDVKSLVVDFDFTKVKSIVAGGKERKDSVACGFEELDPGADIVLIHDAARPFLDDFVLNNILESMKSYKAAFPAVPVVDTIKQISVSAMEVNTTLERSELVCVQTPQAFSVDMVPLLIKKAKDVGNAYDEAMLLEGVCPIKVVEGSQNNFKITSKTDLLYAEFLLKSGGR